jgi:hypothetical protein
MLQRENVTLDAFCNMIEGVRRSSSMASSARLIVLAYFRLLQQINTPPFVDPDIVNKQQSGTLESPPPPTGPLPVLQLAIRRFAQDEAHGR